MRSFRKRSPGSRITEGRSTRRCPSRTVRDEIARRRTSSVARYRRGGSPQTRLPRHPFSAAIPAHPRNCAQVLRQSFISMDVRNHPRTPVRQIHHAVCPPRFHFGQRVFSSGRDATFLHYVSAQAVAIRYLDERNGRVVPLTRVAAAPSPVAGIKSARVAVHPHQRLA